MTALDAIAAPAAQGSVPSHLTSPTHQVGSVDFAATLANSFHDVENRVAHADALVAAFATDDSIPVHQVTIALEQARLSVELALQVRTKLVDAFHEIMTMQL